MNISIIGTGYVGLVTGVSLSKVGHNVTCIDIDKEKIERLNSGHIPIYEKNLKPLLFQGVMANRLHFFSNFKMGLKEAQVIYLTVGTPQKQNGKADLTFIEDAAKKIAENVSDDFILVTKSTVPVGTNHHIKEIVSKSLGDRHDFEIVSNPEFLREGSAVHDSFNGDRIVIGADNEKAAQIIEEINKPFGIPIFKTDIRSAEMIKYASNAFLATKISFINEIANICEKLEANVQDVAYGMGLDHRIGKHFLNAGIGYGGSCFPKDTNALVQIAGNLEHEFELLKAVINVNNNQQSSLVKKAMSRFGSLKEKKVSVLGLAFKPETDDMREAPSIQIIESLVKNGCEVVVYDPVASENAKKVLPNDICYAKSIDEALKDSNILFIITDWDEIKNLNLEKIDKLMKNPIVFDGRNCFPLNDVKQYDFEYHSIGRPVKTKTDTLVV